MAYAICPADGFFFFFLTLVTLHAACYTKPMLTITKPNDLHLHIRDNQIMDAVLPYTAKTFAKATIMPNLSPPIITTQQAQNYRDRILKSLEKNNITNFQPLMTSYLTDTTNHKDIEKGISQNIITAVKMYPANATTNSQHGLTDFFKPHNTYKTLTDTQTPLLIHGEVTDPGTDIYDREKLFINNVLKKLIDLYPNLKIVLEHITTEDAVQFVQSAGDNVAATITPHHLHINRSDMFAGGRVRPHLFCLPIAKREHHRQALVSAAISGDKSFFAGSDSAPHLRGDKEAACGCAGIFCAPTALCDYVEVFDGAGVLDRFEDFVYGFGRDFYGLGDNEETVTLVKESYKVPDEIAIGGGKVVVPFRAGETIGWQVA